MCDFTCVLVCSTCTVSCQLTWEPADASAKASCAEKVDLPTPPLPDSTRILWRMWRIRSSMAATSAHARTGILPACCGTQRRMLNSAGKRMLQYMKFVIPVLCKDHGAYRGQRLWERSHTPPGLGIRHSLRPCPRVRYQCPRTLHAQDGDFTSGAWRHHGFRCSNRCACRLAAQPGNACCSVAFTMA